MPAASKSIFITLSLGFILMQGCASKTPYNPYLSAKEKPSDKQRKEEKKQMRAGEKAYKDQMKRNNADIRKHRGAMSMKAQYKKTTKVKRNRRKYDFHF